MEKTLIVIGTYPNTQISIDVLKKCIESFNDKFDIVVSSHYPINQDIQNICNYYVYDSNNEIIEEHNNPIIWFKNDAFYLQIKHIKNHAYSAYSTILNALTVLYKKYNDFIYINGDTLLSESDILKLIDLKYKVKNIGKKAFFFKEFEGMVDAKIFYSDTNFFLNSFSNVKTKDEFVSYTKNFNSPYVPNILESYYAQRIDMHFLNDVFIINEKIENYFNTSQIDVLISFNGNSEKKRDYQVYLVKENNNNSNRIFFVYINNNINFEPKKINVKLNDENFVLDNGYYSFFKEIIYHKKEVFLEVENSAKVYEVDDILKNNDSYIRFN